jgi:hypothetical protein
MIGMLSELYGALKILDGVADTSGLAVGALDGVGATVTFPSCEGAAVFWVFIVGVIDEDTLVGALSDG